MFRLDADEPADDLLRVLVGGGDDCVIGAKLPPGEQVGVVRLLWVHVASVYAGDLPRSDAELSSLSQRRIRLAISL